MSRWPACIICFSCILSVVQGADSSSTPRVAIVTEAPALRPAVDILTAELSRRTGLALVERDAIEKIRGEQTLAAANRNMVALGKMLEADGVLFLQIVREGTNVTRQASLVWVQGGVLAGTIRFPWSERDPQGSGAWLARRLDPLWPKLRTPPNDAFGISVVGFRSAVRSRDAIEAEKQVTTLLAERLTREPRLFVLERRRMDVLAQEKDFGTDDSSFWAGSYLLDGVIDRDGYSPDRVIIHGRLTPPHGGTPLAFETREARTNLAAAIEGVAAEVKRTLKLSQPARAWEPRAEAAELVREAVWALKWGLLDDAKAAGESAWGLGKQDLESAAARLRVYLALILLDTSGIQPSEMTDDTTEGKARAADRQLRMGIGDHVIWATRGNKTFSATIESHPKPAKIDEARELLELYRFLSRAISAETLPATNEWFLLGCDSLERASLTLQHYNLVPRAQPAVADKLAALRAETRALWTWLKASPAGKDTVWQNGRPGTHADVEGRRLGWGSRSKSLQISAWNWGRFWHERPEDTLEMYRQLLQVPGLWKELHDQLIDSKFEGIPPITAWNAQDTEKLASLWDAFVKEAIRIPPPQTGPAPDLADRQRAEAIVRAARSNIFWNMYSNRPVLGTNSARSTNRPALSPAQVPVTNALVVTNYFAIPTEQLKTGEDREVVREWSIRNQQVLDDRLWLHLGYVHAYSMNYLTADGRWGGRSVTTNLAATAVLGLSTKRWELIHHPYAEKDPWLANPEVPGGRMLPRGVLNEGFKPILEYSAVHDGAVYVSGLDYLRRFDLKTRKWETRPAPWQAPPALTVIGSKLYGANIDMIFEIVTWPENIRVLASCRRRPAVTALDKLEAFDRVQLGPGPPGALRAFVSGMAYTWQGGDWLPVVGLTNCLLTQFDDRAAYVKSGPQWSEPSLWRLPNEGMTPELCLAPPTRASQLPGLRVRVQEPQTPASPQPKWTLPAGIAIRSLAVASFNDSLLTLLEQAKGGAGVPYGIGREWNGRHADLLCLEPGSSEPIMLPLRFSAPGAEVYLPPMLGADQHNAFMKVVGEWLLIGQFNGPGVWAIRTTELAGALEREKSRAAAGKP